MTSIINSKLDENVGHFGVINVPIIKKKPKLEEENYLKRKIQEFEKENHQLIINKKPKLFQQWLKIEDRRKNLEEFTKDPHSEEIQKKASILLDFGNGSSIRKIVKTHEIQPNHLYRLAKIFMKTRGISEKFL